MPANKKKRTKQFDQQPQTSSNIKKGKIVERITAAFHDNPDVTIRLNAFLPVVGGGRRRREIDVLVVGQLAGYTMRIAFECKNERSAVGVQKLDEFIGKLKDVGIPPQNGVYVSASGYTAGAIERAQKEGVRALKL
ncbi:MAG TPA: restriction endonuclease, partial [Blastocatellia bacterium]|nr:restriction endonuclease [Blastocatellia bacterium]